MAACGMPMQVNFQQSDRGVFDTVVEMFTGLLSRDCKTMPDLTNQALLSADRGYLRKQLIEWWLRFGGEINGSSMRQDFLPFTYGKDEKHTKKTGQKNITSSFKVVHQATLWHNLGRRSGKDLRLTCTLYNSGISSSPHLAIHSEHHRRHMDFVAASSVESKWYHDPNLFKYERCMKAMFFWLVRGMNCSLHLRMPRKIISQGSKRGSYGMVKLCKVQKMLYMMMLLLDFLYSGNAMP
jgi:hypothetical protein